MTDQPDLRSAIAEAFNRAYVPNGPGHESLDEVSRHDGHNYSGGCFVCRGDVEKLTDAVVSVVAPLLAEKEAAFTALSELNEMERATRAREAENEAEKFRQLQDQIDDLRAGADPTPVTPGVQMTPGQLLHRLITIDVDERLDLARRIIADNDLQADADAARATLRYAEEWVCDLVEDYATRRPESLAAGLDSVGEMFRLADWLHAEAVWMGSQAEASRRDWAAEATRLSWIHELISPELGTHPRVCACITDDQAASLGPGFSPPQCSVHTDQSTDADRPRRCYCGGPEEQVYGHEHGSGRQCRSKLAVPGVLPEGGTQ